MRTIPRSLCLACVIALSACLGAGEEAPKPDKSKRQWQQLRPERLVSDSTFLYLSTPDLKKARAAFERSALRGLLREEEISVPILSTFSKLRDTYVKGDGIRNEAELRRRNEEVDLLLKLLPLLDGHVALAVDMETDAPNRLPHFLLAASMPPGDAGEERQRLLEELFDRYRSSQTTDARFKDIDERIGTYDVHRIENNDLGLKEGWAFVENLFIYGQGNRVVEDAIERFSVKNGAGTLSQHTGYQNAYKEVGRDDRGDAMFYMQVDARGIVKRLADANPALKALVSSAPTALETNRPHLAFGMQMSEGENAAIREKMFFRTPKDALPARANDPCKALTARFAQNDALYFGARQVNVGEAFKIFMERLKAGGGDGTMEQQVRAALGAQNEAELQTKLDMFKGEMALFVSYVPQPNLKFETPQDFFEIFQLVIVAELDRDVNEVAFRDLMTSIEAKSKQAYVSTQVSGVNMRYQKGAAPREEKTSPNPLGLLANIHGAFIDPGNMPFFLAYARVDIDEPGAQPRKYLVLSDNYNALRKSIQQSRSARTSLAEDPRFKDLIKTFRESRQEIAFVELGKLVDIYNTMLPLLGRTGIISRETMNQFPSANALRPHLFPMAWATSMLNDPEGMLIETYSPTGNLPMASLVGLAAWPAVVAAQGDRVSKEVDDKFKRVLLGMHLYAADFDRFPQQLSELYPNYVKDLSVFESPFKRGAIKSAQECGNTDRSYWCYVPNR